MDAPTAELYLERHARARAEMTRQGVDVLFVTPSSDLLYLLGYPAHASERLTLLGIPRDGAPFVVVPRLEAPRLDAWRERIDLHIWDETESPYALVAQLVEGAAGRRIGISDHARAIVLLRLLELLPEAKFHSATPVLRELRMCKDAWEIEQLRIASERTDAVWEQFIASSTLAGRTERAVAEEITTLLRAQGLSAPSFLIVASGPGSASPHYMTSERVIQRGDAVVFDFGARWNYYTSDLTRTVYVGEPSAEYRRAYEVVLRANQAAFEAVRPGAACEAIDRAARDVIEAAGYGEYFIHRLGHGLGLDGHEEPYLVGGNDLPLRAGMVFSDEPGVYLPGRFGIRIEDTVVCREDGAERLNHCRRELTIMH
jgi:Xaa-Pro aminopeptidase